MQTGVPRGLISGPLFWLAFVNDCNPPLCYKIRLAPSTQSTANAVIQYGLDWSEVNGMQLNLEKTKAMAIRHYRSAQTLKTSIAIGHHEVE